MIWNIEFGVLLLLLGLTIAYRAIRFGVQEDTNLLSDSARKQLNRHQSDRGRTILVQVVDDFGRDLPSATVQKLMANAQAQANPRDTVIAVRHKVEKE